MSKKTAATKTTSTQNTALLSRILPKILIAFLVIGLIGGYGVYDHFFADKMAKPIPKNEQTIFNELDETVEWYRQINTISLSGISTREAFLQETLHKNVLKSLRYSFDVARIQASLFDDNAVAVEEQNNQPAKADHPPSNAGAMTPEQIQIVIATKQRTLEQQLKTAQTALYRTKKSERDLLTAQISKLNSELALVKLQSDLIGNVFNATNTDNQTLSLEKQIDNLAATLPELDSKKTTATTSNTASTTTPSAATGSTVATAITAVTGIPLAPVAEKAATPEKDSKGLLRLSRDLFSLLSQKQEIKELLVTTQALQKQNKDKLQELQTSIVAIVKRSNEMSQEPTSDVQELTSQNQELDEMAQNFKAMSDLIIPINKKKRTLDQSEQALTEWTKLFDEGLRVGLRRIMDRLLGIALALIFPFVLSEIMRRALSQYVKNARQRRQLNIVRRVILGFAIGLIILLNLVSELASMATFIGFVTAGLAVALQNIILSIVAHFFFFGRYGIRVGSRVSIGSTTGDVIEMGIVRLYLMEMIEEKGQYRATGRIVSYPNSILFQSNGFFKQVPGANYRWHEVTLSLPPETERALARSKLNEAIESIYQDSKSMLAMQRVAMEKSTRMKVKDQRPDGTIEKTSDSLNLTIRYPVDVEQSDQTDKNVMQQITEIFERLPAVKLQDHEPQIVKKPR